MKKTIAYKKQSAGILYIVITFVGIGVLVAGVASHHTIATLMGVLIAILGGVFAVQFCSLPSRIIVLTDNETLLLPKGKSVPLGTIHDVSYSRASARGIQYSWGSVTISTYSDTYKYGFVANCEDVAKELTRLMYDTQKIKGK